MSAVLPLTDYQNARAGEARSGEAHSRATRSSQSLAGLGIGSSAHIVSVAAATPEVTMDLIRRLFDLGFLPGEPVRVLARGPVGGEPIAVRVGTSTFALRRQEAACIEITQ